jgi:DNA-binding NarL/FixJ family response regulator
LSTITSWYGAGSAVFWKIHPRFTLSVKPGTAMKPSAWRANCTPKSWLWTSGLVATRKILENAPDTKILMLSMHSENTWVRQALEAGARGYVLKSAVDLELVTAVKKIASGEKVLDPQVEHAPVLKGEREYGLTQRELEILQKIVDGKSNKEIAAELNLSVNTVAVHRANIMDALGIHKTAELVVYAIRNGLVNIP